MYALRWKEAFPIQAWYKFRMKVADVTGRSWPRIGATMMNRSGERMRLSRSAPSYDCGHDRPLERTVDDRINPRNGGTAEPAGDERCDRRIFCPAPPGMAVSVPAMMGMESVEDANIDRPAHHLNDGDVSSQLRRSPHQFPIIAGG